MWLGKQLKKNNGSALTIVLFMLFMLSVMAIAVIALTGSELSMSVMTSDRSKAMQYAQAGAEKAAQIIDGIVAQAQEDARTKASEEVQIAIDDVKQTNKPVDGEVVYFIPEGSIFYGVIDNSDPNDVKIIDKDRLNEIFENEYKYQLNELIKNKMDASVVGSGDYVEKGGSYSYKDFSLEESDTTENKVLEPSTTYILSNLVKVKSTGEYTSPATGSKYKRSIAAEFEILYDQIPKQIGYMTKVRVNNLEDKPSILNGKALIAQENILSIGGRVSVSGNVVSCGTVPFENGNIKYSADSYAFGGIIAGMTSDTWNNVGWAKGIKTKLDDKSGLFANMIITNNNVHPNINTLYKNNSGSFDVDGNVGTLSYIHSLYSINNQQSNIIVSGDTYARSAIVESQSNYSFTSYKNLYVYDDLKIDGNNAHVFIGQEPDKDRLIGLNKNISYGNDIISSAVIVAGDSYLTVNGSVYVGGSSFYTNYFDSSGKKFVSGISIQKSDDRPAAAFERNGNNKYNEYNDFYKYKNTANDYEIISQDKIEWFDCDNRYGNDTSMMNGSGTDNPFNILQRAMHFKNVWEKWQNDVEYASYFNTGDIRISKESSGKLKGYCYGGVAANETFYDPYNGFTDTVTDYDTIANNGKIEYSKFMDLFIKNPNDEDYLNLPDSQKTDKELKHLSDNVNNTIFTKSTSYRDTNKFMYYGSGDVVLSNNSITDGTTTEVYGGGMGCGIVYAKGNIYVKDGTIFKGILIAEGNIVFFGSAEITYDKDVVDELIINGDPNIGRFFKHTASDVIMNDDNAIIQTINKKNVKYIKVVSWKEIDG